MNDGHLGVHAQEATHYQPAKGHEVAPTWHELKRRRCGLELLGLSTRPAQWLTGCRSHAGQRGALRRGWARYRRRHECARRRHSCAERNMQDLSCARWVHISCMRAATAPWAFRQQPTMAGLAALHGLWPPHVMLRMWRLSEGVRPGRCCWAAVPRQVAGRSSKSGGWLRLLPRRLVLLLDGSMPLYSPLEKVNEAPQLPLLRHRQRGHPSVVWG